MAQIQIEEGEHARLVAEAGRVQTLEAERDAAVQRATVAEGRLTTVDAQTAARPIVTAIFAESTTLPAPVVARVVESVVAAAPLTDAGALDEAALRTTATAARTAAEAEVAAIAESLGAGRVRGFGSSTATDLTESTYDARSARVFNRPTVKGA
jgi:cell pole-organizing protein PopZ